MSALTLKRKLKALNYPTEFSEDSAELIERLLGDLVRASEAYQLLKRESAKNSSVPKPDDRTLQNHIQILQRENNELHAKLISAEEKLLVTDGSIKKLSSENKELTALLKFVQNGGKNDFQSHSLDYTNITKKTSKEHENAKLEMNVKVEHLEKINESLKSEINRLRNLYEGQFKYENFDSQTQILIKEQQKSKEEALNNQMNFLVQRNDELEQIVKSYQNSKVPQLIDELDKVKMRLKDEQLKCDELSALVKTTEQKLIEVKQQAEDNNQKFACMQSPGYLNKLMEDLQAKYAQKNQELLEKDKELMNMKRIVSDTSNSMITLKKESEEAKLTVEIVKKEVESLEKKAQDQLLRDSERNFELETMSYKLRFFESQIEELNKKKVDEENKINELLTLNSNLKADLQSSSLNLKKANFDLEQNKVMLSQKQELETRLREKISSLENDLKAKDSQIILSSHDKIVMKESEKVIAQFEKTITDKDKLLLDFKEAINSKELEIYDQGQKLATLNQKTTELEMTLKSIEMEKNNLTEELLTAKQKLKSQAHLEKELQNAKNQYQALLDASIKKEDSEDRIRSLKLEIENYKNSNQLINDNLQEALKSKATLQEQLHKGDEEIKTKISDIFSLQIKVKTLEEELGLAQLKLNYSEQTVSSLQKRGEKVTNEIESTHVSLTETRKMMIEKDSMINALTEDLKKKSQNIESLKIENKNLTSQIEVRQGELQALGITLQKTQKQLDYHNEKQEYANQTIQQLDQQLVASSKNLSDLQEENQKLVKLLKAASAHKEELLKLEISTQRPIMSEIENQLEDSKQECQRLREQIKNFSESENDLKYKLVKLDHVKDEVQDLLDTKTEQFDELTKRYEKMHKEFLLYVEEKSQLEQIISQLSYKLDSTCHEKDQSTTDLATLNEELKTMKTLKGKLDREKHDLVSDLQILAAENRSLSNELMVVSKRLESFERKLEAKNEDLKKKEFELGASTLENSQLVNNCKLFEQENFNIKQNIAKLQANYEAIHKKNRTLEQQAEVLKYELDSLETQKESLMYELSVLQNNYNKLSLELQSKEINKLDQDQAGRILQQKLENAESLNAKIQKELLEKQKALTSIANEFNELKQNFLFVKTKNDELVSKLTLEMKKTTELEGALADERSRHASILGSIYKNKAIASEVESKIERAEKLIKFK